mmetsp:Transcript_11552/g.36923  ORF Transcript_11552/g.36923 Transcript_11552/m.36923 type:complete len:335 (-) Transcript_11552:144-1148(-)
MSTRVIGIVGTGAVARTLATCFMRGGHPVHLLSHSMGSHARALASSGLTVRAFPGENSSTWPLFWPSVRPLRSSGAAERYSMLFTAVKSYSTSLVAPLLPQLLDQDGVVVSLQNGAGNVEVLQEAAGCRVLGGTTTLGAFVDADNGLHVVSRGQTKVGLAPCPQRMSPASEAVHAAPAAVARLLSECGLPCVQVPGSEIYDCIWAKLLLNAAINPLAARLGKPNGALLEPENRVDVEAVVHETLAVAHATGHLQDWDESMALDAVLALCHATRNNMGSMVSDVLRGTQTEIESITGFVVREGQRCGMDTPVSAALRAALLGSHGPLGASGGAKL